MITQTPRAQDIQKPTEEADYHTVSLFERSAFLSDPPTPPHNFTTFKNTEAIWQKVPPGSL